jgi:hypothetical protein
LLATSETTLQLVGATEQRRPERERKSRLSTATVPRPTGRRAAATVQTLGFRVA